MDLIGLRSRGKSERRFEVMSDLRRAAEKDYLARERELAETLKKTQERLNDLQGKSWPDREESRRFPRVRPW